MQSLASANAVVVLLTPESMQSPMVISEVGAARAFATTERKMALLPVLLGLPEIPNFIQDLFVLQADSAAPSEVERIADEIDKAVEAHLSAVSAVNAATAGPRIFISHRHDDAEVAGALTRVLRAAFDLSPRDIRCTSIQPYRLPFGKNTGERLRDEIRGAEVVLGILAPDTAKSSYVMFELGAAWGQRIYTCPLLSREAGFQHIPGPRSSTSLPPDSGSRATVTNSLATSRASWDLGGGPATKARCRTTSRPWSRLHGPLLAEAIDARDPGRGEGVEGMALLTGRRQSIMRTVQYSVAGWGSPVTRPAHNLKVSGSIRSCNQISMCGDIGPNRFQQYRTVSWLISLPRSWRRSSTFRSESKIGRTSSRRGG